MTLHIALCRHGQGAANAQRILRSTGDDELTELGGLQAIELSKWAQFWRPKAVVSSTLLRAVQTATVVGRSLTLPVTQLIELRERHYGDFEGLSIDEVRELRTKLGHRFLDVTQDWKCTQSIESDIDVANRVLAAIIGAAKTDRILAVTHAGVLVSVLRFVIGIDYPTGIVKFPHCSRLILEFGGSSWTLHGIVPPTLP